MAGKAKQRAMAAHDTKLSNFPDEHAPGLIVSPFTGATVTTFGRLTLIAQYGYDDDGSEFNRRFNRRAARLNAGIRLERFAPIVAGDYLAMVGADSHPVESVAPHVADEHSRVWWIDRLPDGVYRACGLAGGDFGTCDPTRHSVHFLRVVGGKLERLIANQERAIEIAGRDAWCARDDERAAVAAD